MEAVFSLERESEMAINKWMKAALKALSYPDIDVKKNYKLYRAVNHKMVTPVKYFYHMKDFKIEREGYEIPVRIFEPDTVRSKEILLFFHGGGWVIGNIESYTKPCACLAKALGRRVFSVDYRLAPEFPFPYAINDCYRVSQAILENCHLLGAAPEDIVLMGDSAGGNLAACVSLMARDRGGLRPSRQILLYPATGNDHSEEGGFPSARQCGRDYLLTSKRVCDYVDLYIQREADFYSPYFAPLLAEDLSLQPETLIITAEFDPLRDEGEAYGEKLISFGNSAQIFRLRDALHGFFTLPRRFVHVQRTYSLIETFLNGDNTYEY